MIDDELIRFYYAVMNIQPWDTLEVSATGFPFKGTMRGNADPAEPCGFLAVFSTIEAALDYAGNDPVLKIASAKELP